jgi:hypothetical protein
MTLRKPRGTAHLDADVSGHHAGDEPHTRRCAGDLAHADEATGADNPRDPPPLGALVYGSHTVGR